MKYIRMLLSSVFLVSMIGALDDSSVNMPPWLIPLVEGQDSNTEIGEFPAQLAALRQLHDQDFGYYTQMPVGINEEIPGL